VAPRTLRTGISELIQREIEAVEAGGLGRIVMKMNALTDDDLIEQLYTASEAGVRIDLIIRGICALVPGAPGQSSNIRVRSLVGRYLEHSRIFLFANGEDLGVPRYLLGSADLRARNLDRRVEALVSVSEPSLQARLQEVLDLSLEDDTLAWQLSTEGAWTRTTPADPAKPHNAQRRLQDLAVARSRSA
jgi:polyphosphate kinase